MCTEIAEYEEGSPYLPALPATLDSEQHAVEASTTQPGPAGKDGTTETYQAGYKALEPVTNKPGENARLPVYPVQRTELVLIASVGVGPQALMSRSIYK